MSQIVHQLLVIEDHSIYRAGLISVIQDAFCAFVVEVCAIEKALDLEVIPDLILLDIQLEGMSGLSGMTQLLQRWPGTKIIIISANDSYANTQSAFDAGATAFLSKSDTAENILSILSKVLVGHGSGYMVSDNVKNKIASAPKLSNR